MLVNENLAPNKPDKDVIQFVDLLLPKIKKDDKILEFYSYACLSSIFFREALSQSDSYVSIVKSVHNEACAINLKESKSDIKLDTKENLDTILTRFFPTILIVNYNEVLSLHSNEERQSFFDLINSLESLRIVAFLTDFDTTNEVLPKLYSMLKHKDFHPHVTGKYTIFIKNEIPEKIKEITKSPPVFSSLLAFAILLFCIFLTIYVSNYVWTLLK